MEFNTKMALMLGLLIGQATERDIEVMQSSYNLLRALIESDVPEGAAVLLDV